MDVGEMFLKFWLNKFLCLYAGIDVGLDKDRSSSSLGGVTDP